MKIILCKFGCGRTAKFQMKNGTMCCSKNHASCPSIRKKFSENNCMKRPEMRIIAGNSMRGKKRNLEAIRITAEKNKGQYRSLKVKQKMSESKKGYKLPEHQKQWMRDHNPMKNLESVKKMIDTNRKIGNYNPQSIDRKNHISKIMKEKFNTHYYKNLFSEIGIKNFKDSEYLKKLQKSLHLKPNKPETLIIKILKDLNLEKYKYNGDYSVWIDGKNPDFLCEEEKKVIEFFGAWWHDEDRIKITKEEHEKNRINHFFQNGYKCLIIWEEDLKEVFKAVQKILDFEKLNSDYCKGISNEINKTIL